MDLKKLASRIAQMVDQYHGFGSDPEVERQIIHDFRVFKTSIRVLVAPSRAQTFVTDRLVTGDTPKVVQDKFADYARGRMNYLNANNQGMNLDWVKSSMEETLRETKEFIDVIGPNRVNMVLLNRNEENFNFEAGWVLHDLCHITFVNVDLGDKDFVHQIATSKDMEEFLTEDCDINLNQLIGLNKSTREKILIDSIRIFKKRQFIDFIVKNMPEKFLKSGESHKYNFNTGEDLGPDILPISIRNFNRISQCSLGLAPFDIKYENGKLNMARGVSGSRSKTEIEIAKKEGSDDLDYGNLTVHVVPKSFTVLDRLTQRIMTNIIGFVDEQLAENVGEIVCAFF